MGSFQHEGGATDRARIAAWLAVMLAGLGTVVGCGPEHQNAQATVQAAPTTSVADTFQRECPRVAGAKDLQPVLFFRKDAASGFPVSVVKLYNAADEPVIVGYEPGSVIVHCGDYEQRGPADTFVHRREILNPQQPLEIEVPAGGWTRSTVSGGTELMLPTQLPPGKYALWASFQVEGARGGTISTAPDAYQVP